MARNFQYQNKTDPIPQPAQVVVTSVAFALAITSQVTFCQQFIYQAKADPIPVAENITVDKWFEPLSEPVRTRRLSVAQQDVAADLPFVENTTFESKWHQAWSEPRRTKRQPAAEQSYAPFVAVTVTTAVETSAVSSDVIFSRWRIFQTNTESLSVTETIFEDKWHQGWSDPVRTRRFNTALQDSVADVAFVEDTTLESKWHQGWSEPVRQKLGLKAALQQALAAPVFTPVVTPSADIAVVQQLDVNIQYEARVQYQVQTYSPFFVSEIVTVDKWFVSLSDPVRRRVFGTAQQDSVADFAFVEDKTFESKWHQAWSEPVRYRRLATAQQSTTVLGVPTFEVITEDKWHYPWSEPVRLKRGVAYQQPLLWSGFTPTVTEDEWHQPWSTPLRSKLRVVYQQPFFWSGFTPTFTFFPMVQGDTGLTLQKTIIYQVAAEAENPEFNNFWYAPWSEPTRLKRSITNQQSLFWSGFTPTAVVSADVAVLSFIGVNIQYEARIQYQSLAYPTFFTAEVVTVDKWIYPWSEPVRYRPGLAARYQQTLAWGYTTPEATSEDKWHYPWSEPVRTRRYNTALQDPVADIPFVENTTFESKWHQPWSDPVRFRRLTTAQQQWLAWEPVFVTEIIFEDKWHFPWSEPVRQKKGLAAHEQQFLAYSFSKPIVSFAYYNWLSEPVRLKRGLEVRYQQFFTTDTKPFVTFGFYGWLSEPVRLKKGLRADEQQAFIGPPAFPNLQRTIPWFEPLSEPVRPKKGLWARLQQFFVTDSKPITNQVTVILHATETNNDAAFFAVSVYNKPVRAYVSIKEVPGASGDDAYASIEEVTAVFVDTLPNVVVQRDGQIVTDRDGTFIVDERS